MITKDWDPDVQTTVIGGADASSEPELIGAQAAAHLRNISIRGGRARSRPRYKKVLDLPSGKIQGGFAFKDRSLLFVSIDGKVFEIDPADWSSVEKTDATTRGNPNRPRHYYVETVGSMVIQDFQNTPLIYDGSEFRAAEDDEVPVGGAMAFANGRLAVVVNNGRSVRIGDIRDGGVHQSELKFTETYALLGGGDLSFPSRVLALSSLPVIDTSTGQGSLIVGCRERAFSLKTQVTSRDLWPDIGFQTDFIPVGITGPTAVVPVNQDLYFRSPDGFRSIRSAVSDVASPGLTPLSGEMRHRFDFDTPSMLDCASVALFDNRIFVTHSPIAYGNRSINLGLAVYNLDTLSKSGQKSPPVWEGEWDGIQIAELVSGKFRGTDRLFAIGRDVDGNNGIWEIAREVDDPVGITESPTQEFVSRSFVGKGINDFKALCRCDVWLSEVKSSTNLKVYFRSDKHPFWVKWDEFSMAATPGTSLSRRRPLRRMFSTRTAPHVFDARVNQYLDHGFTFQIRLVWTGTARLDQLQLWTKSIGQPGVAGNVENATEVQYAEAPAGQEDPGFWFPFTSSPAP